jgi:hypothetical protein
MKKSKKLTSSRGMGRLSKRFLVSILVKVTVGVEAGSEADAETRIRQCIRETPQDGFEKTIYWGNVKEVMAIECDD